MQEGRNPANVVHVPLNPRLTLNLDSLKVKLIEAVEGTANHEIMHPGAKKAAVLVILYSKRSQPHLLFTRRSNNVLSHRGEISFPGGAMESADFDLLATALREGREELGIAFARKRVIGALQDVWTFRTNYTIRSFVLVQKRLPKPNPSRPEIDEVLEIPLGDLLDPLIMTEDTREVARTSYPLYYFHHGRNVIWGATGRILKQLVDIIRSGWRSGKVFSS